MPVVKMGTGAQTQAKHCRGKGEGDRFGCQIQFRFLSVRKRERKSEIGCYSSLASFFLMLHVIL